MKTALEAGKPSFASIIERRKPRIWREWPMEAPIKIGATAIPKLSPDNISEFELITPAVRWYSSISSKVFRASLQTLQDECNSLAYTPKMFSSDLRKFSGDLREAIPPIESGLSLEARTPATLAAILNVGWMAIIADLPRVKIKVNAPAHLQDGAKAERVHGLLLKAIELCEIRRQWEKAKWECSEAKN
jgi:hypothetical protein